VILSKENSLLELVLSVTGSREVQAVLSVPYQMTQTSNQDLIRYVQHLERDLI
jgi:hypothetical protein